METDEKWDEKRFIQLQVTWYEFLDGKLKKSVTYDTVNEMIVEDENEWDFLGDTAVEISVLGSK